MEQLIQTKSSRPASLEGNFHMTIFLPVPPPVYDNHEINLDDSFRGRISHHSVPQALDNE
jgi:hypothetical protein